jgi:hypothetical protein
MLIENYYGKINLEGEKIIQVRKMKWKSLSGVLCDKRISRTELCGTLNGILILSEKKCKFLTTEFNLIDRKEIN